MYLSCVRSAHASMSSEKLDPIRGSWLCEEPSAAESAKELLCSSICQGLKWIYDCAQRVPHLRRWPSANEDDEEVISARKPLLRAGLNLIESESGLLKKGICKPGIRTIGRAIVEQMRPIAECKQAQ